MYTTYRMICQVSFVYPAIFAAGGGGISNYPKKHYERVQKIPGYLEDLSKIPPI